jgi:hypothetical protein
MGTTLGQEYATANRMIEEILAGNRTVRVRAQDVVEGKSHRGRLVPGTGESVYELTIYDMTPEERARFTHGYETLFDNAERYYLRRPHRGAIQHDAARPVGGAHHLDGAIGNGLIPSTTSGVYEGVRLHVEAAARAYRGTRYTVTEETLAGGVLVVVVRSIDLQFEVALRSWPDSPGYIPHDDRTDLRRTKSAAEVRDWYHAQLAGFGQLDQAWQEQAVPLAERARRAYEMRHNARLAAREQMPASAVVPLETRDLDLYDNPDGPTFDGLIEKLIATGKTRDQAYEALLESARRSNAGYDARARAQKDQR